MPTPEINTETVVKKTPEAEVKTEPEVKKENIGFGIDFEDLLSEVEKEDLNKQESQAVTEDHTCFVPKEEEEIEVASTQKPLEVLALSDESLQATWIKMMEWFKDSEQQNLLELLSEHKPKAKGKNVVITLDSSVEKTFIENNTGLIKGFLKRNFNDFEDLELKVTKSTKSKKVLLNQKDKFELLAKKNPLLNKFREDLGLELEM